MNKYLKYLLFIELSLFPIISVVSWVYSIYVPTIRSLITPLGFRWIATSFLSNISSLPLAECLLLLISLSVIRTSGISSAFTLQTSLKKKRAIIFSSITLTVNILMILALIFLRPYVLLNFFGGFTASPLIDSIPIMLFVAIETTCCTYGYTSGKMNNMHDFSVAHSYYIQKFSPLFIHLFLLAQLWSWIGYTAIFNQP